MRRRHASSSGKPSWQPSGTVRATPAVIRFSRSINPICTASRSKPPSELKKIGRSRFAKTVKNSRNRWAALSSNWPCLAIHSLQPRPQAFGSPVATTKIIGSLWTFASKRSSSLGSSLAAIETAGRQQSAAATHRINFRIITPLRVEDRLSYYAFIDHRSPGVDRCSDLVDRYSRVANCHAAEFREGLQQEDARSRPAFPVRGDRPPYVSSRAGRKLWRRPGCWYQS